MSSEPETHNSQWRQWLAALAASSVLLSSTFDAVWTTRHGYRALLFETLNQTVSNTIFVIIGAILGAGFANVYGRKRTLLMSSIFVIPRIASLNFVSAELRWTNDLFMSMGSGIACTVVPLYISEIADTNIRRTLMVLPLPVLTFGVLAAETAVSISRSEHVLHLIGIVNNVLLIIPILFHVIILGIFPETPRYLHWKKRYHEAARSLAFFRGVDRVEVTGGGSVLLINGQLNNDGHSWRAKIREIMQFENRRSLAIIFSLIAIKWANGQLRNEFNFILLTKTDFSSLSIWAVKLIFSVFVMFTIGVFERKLSLMLVTLGSSIAAIIPIVTPGKYDWIMLGCFSIPVLAHNIYAAVILAYVGQFFPINIRAIASALIIGFEIMVRNMALKIEELLFYPIMAIPFAISGALLFFAFFLVLVFFPKTNHVPCSEITIESPAGRGSGYRWCYTDH